MAEIEKKYSDYQTSECDTQEPIEPIDARLCPTCQPNPDWKLPAPHWSDIDEAYLNESVCEYHVRVYENERAVFLERGTGDVDLEQAIKKIGVERILVDLDKPLNDGTTQQLLNASFIVEDYRNLESKELGLAYLVGVPAFNMDQIESNDSPDAEESKIEKGKGGEFIIDVNQLGRKFFQLRAAIKTYGIYYASLNKTDGGFVIRKEVDETHRINYGDTRQKIKQFQNELSDRLTAKGYPKIGKPGLFKSKRAKRIKFTFKDSGKPYDLKTIHVLDSECDKYIKIPVKKGNILRKPSMRVVYHFLENLDQVINDITAKETKPWLEFTLEHFYPTYIVDRGSVGDIDDTRAGLECLLETELGLGNGQMIDYLASEILSAFDTIEQKLAEQACRSLGELAEGGATALAEKNKDLGKSPKEEREAAMKARYEKEYENKAYNYLIKQVDDHFSEFESDSLRKKATKENVFKLLETEFLDPVFRIEFQYTDANKAKRPYVRRDPLFEKEDIEKAKKEYARDKFNLLEAGSFSDQLSNSPHFAEAEEAFNEVLDNFENTYLDPVKDAWKGRSEFEMVDLIPTIGLCGMSKIAGKAMECLTNGVSFDDFLDMLIDKTFDFMEVNTLSLFLNGLPASFREELNEAIEENFGSGVDISSLIGIKLAEGGGQKMKDFVKSKQTAKRVLELFEKYRNPEYSATDEEKRFLKSHLDLAGVAPYIKGARTAAGWDFDKKTYSDEEITEIIKGKQKTFKKPEKYVLRVVKEKIREYKKDQSSFGQSMKRVGNAIGSTTIEAFNSVTGSIEEISELEFDPSGQGVVGASIDIAGDALNVLAPNAIITADDIANTPEGELNPFEQAAKSFEETALGVKVDAVFDVIFDFVIESILDSFGVDDLFERMRSYPAVDFALDKIEELFLKPCPVAPVFYPPPNDFMKSLSVDICNPTIGMTFPKLVVPNINFRFKIEYQFNEIFREAIIKLATDIGLNLLTRLMKTLESALCNLVEAAGGIVAEGLRGNLKGSFYRALNEAFCNDGENPETSRSKAEELAEALFAPLSFNSGGEYEGAGERVSNIISSVATADEFLNAMVAREGEENDQFNSRIANAITALAPEMEVLLGDPNQVAYFFRSLGSFLPPEERNRIRDMLDAGVPNLPISQAICLTNDQLDEWNKLREDLLDGDADRVKKLNDATLDALGNIMDDIGDLDTNGPFIGAATNEALKDVCNPNNVFNDVSRSPVDRGYEDELINNFFDNIARSLTKGFMSKGGILAEATRDFEGRREFGRSIQKLIKINYSNSQAERDLKYASKHPFVQGFMDIGYTEAPGVYPDTVAITQRKEILGESGIEFDFSTVKKGPRSSENIVYKYLDAEGDFSYIQKVAVSNLRKPKKTFGYNLQVLEIVDGGDQEREINMNTAVPISQGEDDYMKSVGFQYNSNDKRDIRKNAFDAIMKARSGINKDFRGMYEQVFQEANKNLVEALLSNYEADDKLPIGYKFGYVSDNLTKESFEYTPSENEGELGTFASPRIIPLDPKLYGGRYSNPPYYVEPRRFTGWLELATSAFESQEGCDPKNPPIVSFQDIKDRTKNLTNSIKNDPRLSKSPECASVKPFHVLLDSKNKAKLDGVVRTTIRVYLAEFFMKGYGLFSNLQIRPENFDRSMMNYIVNKMKAEMQDLGTRTSNRKVRIVRERYWYTFLEQCVEAYQRTIDIDNVEAPEVVLDALNRIQMGLDKYRPLDAKMKKRARKLASETTLVRPGPQYDPLDEIAKGNVYNTLMAVAFRLTPEDERETFFDGGQEDKVKGTQIRYAKLKKLQFFQKIYFIKLFEREATIVMEEFIKQELTRLSQLVIDGPTDKPYYFDLYKSFFGMKSFFPQSSSRVGLNSYYLDKQRGVVQPGQIPTIASNNLTPSVAPTDKVQFLVESYVRLEEKEMEEPNPFATREVKYRGAVSLDDMSRFVEDNLDFLEGKYLSDFFGDLSFVYSGSFKSLMRKGFDSEKSVMRLIELNKDVEEQIRNAYRSHLLSQNYNDFDLTYDESFLLEGENQNPSGTIGSTGVKYGLRVCALLPKDYLTPEEIAQIKPRLNAISKEEKAFLFDDGSFLVPLSSAEIDVLDAKFENFDPFSGTERYDLECLINKIVEKPEFTVMFDKLLNFRQASSMLSIYCMETLPAAIGRDETERRDPNGDPDTDDWDRTINKSGKNFLRREFKSIYLSNTEDGQTHDDDDDESLGNLIRLNNPFDFLALPSIKLPWWKKRRMRTKIYDANGQECASPEKDLQ